MHCYYGDECPYQTYILWRFLVTAGNSEITKKVIRYHPFGIGIDIVFGILVPESISGSTEMPKYRISFGIPRSDDVIWQKEWDSSTLVGFWKKTLCNFGQSIQWLPVEDDFWLGMWATWLLLSKRSLNLFGLVTSWCLFIIMKLAVWTKY